MAWAYQFIFNILDASFFLQTGIIDLIDMIKYVELFVKGTRFIAGIIPRQGIKRSKMATFLSKSQSASKFIEDQVATVLYN